MARRARALIWLCPARVQCEIRGIGPEAYSVATMRSWRDFHWSQRYIGSYLMTYTSSWISNSYHNL